MMQEQISWNKESLLSYTLGFSSVQTINIKRQSRSSRDLEFSYPSSQPRSLVAIFQTSPLLMTMILIYEVQKLITEYWALAWERVLPWYKREGKTPQAKCTQTIVLYVYRSSNFVQNDIAVQHLGWDEGQKKLKYLLLQGFPPAI